MFNSVSILLQVNAGKLVNDGSANLSSKTFLQPFLIFFFFCCKMSSCLQPIHEKRMLKHFQKRRNLIDCGYDYFKVMTASILLLYLKCSGN